MPKYDEFGGIEIEDQAQPSPAPQTDEFGGIPMDDAPITKAPVQDEDEVLKQQYLANRNKSIFDKGIEAGTAIPKALYGMVSNAVTGVKSGVDQAREGKIGPSDTGSIVGSAGVSAGTDILSGIYDKATDLANAVKNHPILASNPASLAAGMLSDSYVKPMLGVPASQDEIQQGVDKLKMDKAISEQKQVELNKSPSPELSKALPDIVNLATLGVGGAKSLIKAAPEAVTLAEFGSPIVKTARGAASHVNPINLIEGEPKRELGKALLSPKTVATPEAISKGIDDAALEIYRNNPEGTGLADVLKSAKETRTKAASVLNQARASSNLPPLETNTLLDDLKSKILNDPKMLSTGTKKELDGIFEREVAHLRENFPQMTPDELELNTQSFNNKASPFYKMNEAGQLRSLTNPEKAIIQRVRETLSGSLDNMYQETGGDLAKQSRQIYRGSKTIENAAKHNIEKLANKKDFSGSGAISTAFASGDVAEGLSMLLSNEGLWNELGKAKTLHGAVALPVRMFIEHLGSTNTKAGNFYKQMRSRVKIGDSVPSVAAPQTFTPQPLPPSIRNIGLGAGGSGVAARSLSDNYGQ